MKSTNIFGNYSFPIPETPEEIVNTWNTNELYKRNQVFLQKIYRHIQSAVKTNYYFILEYVRYGNNEGAFGLYWQCGGREYLILSIRYRIDKITEHDDFQSIFAYGLAGILDFIYSKFLYHPNKPIDRMNIRPVIYIEDEVWKKTKNVRSTYTKFFPSSIAIPNPVLYPAQCILLDLYEENPYVLRRMDLMPHEFWNKYGIYSIRQEVVSFAMNTQKADFEVYNKEDLINGRRLFDFRSPCKEDLNFYARKMLIK